MVFFLKPQTLMIFYNAVHGYVVEFPIAGYFGQFQGLLVVALLDQVLAQLEGTVLFGLYFLGAGSWKVS